MMEQKVLFKVHMPKSVDKPLLEVLHSGFIGQGKKVDEFEEKLGKYFGNNKVLTLNSGASSLYLLG
jgi:dTDP-4-amino-4,6-dideoxygalactose transaminase